MKNQTDPNFHSNSKTIESDPSVFQDEETEESSEEDQSQSEINDYLLEIKRPGYLKDEDFNIPELFCGANHDLREEAFPFFNKKFTCVEDKGTSLKYLRQSMRFLL